jgi:hypothetical protein
VTANNTYFRLRLTKRELIAVESLLRLAVSGVDLRRGLKALSVEEAVSLANRLAYIEQAGELRQSLSHSPWRGRAGPQRA